MKRTIRFRAFVLLGLVLSLTMISTRLRADIGSCGGNTITLPFDDVHGSPFFCAIAQAFFTGLTNGTSATTYGPQDLVSRDQMAAFITRTQDSAIERSSRRAVVGQWWMHKSDLTLKRTTMADTIGYSCFDGEDIWVASISNPGTLVRVDASDMRVIGTRTGAEAPTYPIAAAGYIFVAGATNPGRLYRVDPSQPPGPMTEVADNLGAEPKGIAFDGLNIWTADNGTGDGTGSITRYNIVTGARTIFGVGFNRPVGILFDGTHLWVLDEGNNQLYRVNPANGTIIETLSVGSVGPNNTFMAFDGTNLWVPLGNRIEVISTTTPARELATLTGNGLSPGIDASAAAFDGERIMVNGFNLQGGDNFVSLWKATSLTPLGNLRLDSSRKPIGVVSDGLHFWINVLRQGADDLLMQY